MRGQRVLVTGGAGFIGSNLANRLAERNEVIVVDDCSLGTADHLAPGVEFHERSVLDEDLPTEVDIVVHLAALSSYGLCEADPQRSTRVNVEGFVNVVEQARAGGCEIVIYASTSSLYPANRAHAAGGKDVRINTGYEASMRARERYAEYFSTQYGLSMAGLRFFSVYEGYSGAESHKGDYANVITQFADDIANNRSPMVYGDGTQTRDFTHVSDVTRAIESVAECRLNGIYDVGTGVSHSFEQVITLLNETLDTAVAPEYVENPIPDSAYVKHTRADPSALQAATGWEPDIDLETGLEAVCAPYLARPAN